MAGIFLNDTGSNPWVIAEVGSVFTQNVQIASFTYCEADSSAHAVDIADAAGRYILQLNDQLRNIRFDGWIHGVTIPRLDSGYVVVALKTE